MRRFTELTSEIAVVALSFVVTYGLVRLFSDDSFLGELLVIITASHLLAIAVRRAGFGIGVSAVVSTAGLLVVGNVVLFPETAGSMIPTRETLDLLRTDLDLAWETFSAERAPVLPLRGFIAVAAVALWWVAALADWAAFRLRSPLETVVPASIIFVFTVVLGEGSNPILHAALYAGAVAAVMLSLRVARQARDDVWLASGANRGLTSTMRLGVAGTAAAVLIGALAGPALPDAGDQLLDPSDWDDGPQTRFVTSPLVDINANLVNQSEFEMFSVAVDDPQRDRHYWRQMALTDFTGVEWRRSSNFEDARGPVGSDIDPSIARRPVLQTITTNRLGGIYLPAAYEVSRVIDSQGVGLEYEIDTGALVIQRESEGRAAAGFTYIIESSVPEYEASQLPTDATVGLDQGFVDEHTQLPPICTGDETTADECWNPSLTELAEDITAGATTDYQRALALQNFFLDPELFRYDLNVRLDHSLSSMEEFVQFVRRGYCEQFASTFAALARSLGIPARVAVGFTWGEWDDARQEFVVRGEHAHAWPEVYFAGVGWIVLDPTPGRAPVHNREITNLSQPAQLDFNDEVTQDDEAPLDTISPLDSFEPGASPDFTLPDVPTEELPDDAGAAETASSDDGFDAGPLLRVLAALAGVVAIVGAVPTLRWLARRRRRARVAADPVGRSELAWDDAAEALRLVGLERTPSETPREFARRAMARSRPVGPVDDLANAVTVLRYADLDDPVPVTRRAETAAATITETCRSQVSTRRRWSEAMDPRNISMN